MERESGVKPVKSGARSGCLLEQHVTPPHDLRFRPPALPPATPRAQGAQDTRVDGSKMMSRADTTVISSLHEAPLPRAYAFDACSSSLIEKRFARSPNICALAGSSHFHV